MSIYEDQIHQSQLFKRFDALPKNMDGITEGEIVSLKGIVLKIAELVGPQMEQIGKTFRQYTDHSLTHLCNIADIIDRFLPDSKIEGKESIGLNALELTILWAGIMLHDVGMFVTESEKEADLKSESFRRFRQRHKDRVEAADRARKAGQQRQALEIEEALIAEFYRRGHARRSNLFVKANLANRFMFREVDLAEEIGKIAESHNWRVFQRDGGLSNDPYVAGLDVEKLFGSVPANLQYIACCLRMGDIMDFDRSRTPLVIFENMAFTEDISSLEWNKHRSITGRKVSPTELVYAAECERPEDHAAVQEFLDWVDKELDSFSRIVDGFKEAVSRRYPMPLPHRVNRDKVGMKNPHHITGAFKYQLEFGEIMQLLMDKSLYPDPALFLRELLQNSLDACRYQQALARKVGMDEKYIPRIDVWDYSSDQENPRIVFRDNGYGMDMRTIEQYFLRVGKSYYRSPDFAMERELLAEQNIFLDSCSRFGIGFLSCFLAGNNIEVETYRLGAPNPLKINITGPSRYFLIETHEPRKGTIPFLSPSDRLTDGPPDYPGTKVTVHLKPGWREGVKATDSGVVFDTINTYAVATEFPIMVHFDSGRTSLEITGDEFSKMRFPKEYDSDEDRQGLHPLEDLLTMVEIPLPKGDDSLKFSGRLWALMFEDGTKYGGRKHKGMTLKVDGGYRLYDEQFISVGFESNLLSFLESFFEIIDKIHKIEELYALLNDMTKFGFQFERFAAYWLNMNVEERSLAKSLAYTLEFNIVPSQFDLSNFVTYVLEGDTAKIFQAINGKIPESIEAYSFGKHRFALHGILIPSGILNWRPLEGYAAQESFLPEELFATVNLYGGGTPVPSANRLYFPPENTQTAREMLNESILHWALDGLVAHPADNQWMEFFERIQSHCQSNCPSAILNRLEELADRIKISSRSPHLESVEEFLNVEHEVAERIPEELGWVEALKILEDSDADEPPTRVLHDFLRKIITIIKKDSTSEGSEPDSLTSTTLKEERSQENLDEYKATLFDFLTNQVEREGFQPEVEEVYISTDPTLREVLVASKAILPIWSWEFSEPLKKLSYSDLRIFEEAPLIIDEDGQRYRDLRAWVKKYLPSLKIDVD